MEVFTTKYIDDLCLTKLVQMGGLEPQWDDSHSPQDCASFQAILLIKKILSVFYREFFQTKST